MGWNRSCTSTSLGYDQNRQYNVNVWHHCWKGYGAFIFCSLLMKINEGQGMTHHNTHNSHAMEIFLCAVSIRVKSKMFYLLEWFVLCHSFVLRLIHCPVVTLNFGSMEYPVGVCVHACACVHTLVHAGMHRDCCNGTTLPSVGDAE